MAFRLLAPLLMLLAGTAYAQTYQVNGYYATTSAGYQACWPKSQQTGSACNFYTLSQSPLLAGKCSGYTNPAVYSTFDYWPNTHHLFCVPASGNECPSGTIPDASDKCVPSCEFDPALPASDPTCAARKCQNLAEQDHPVTYYASGAGNDGPYCEDSCSFELPMVVDDHSECFTVVGDPPPNLYCPFKKSYSGSVCSAAKSPGASASPNPENSNEALTCPDGFTLDAASGLCNQPGTSGTPSTPTTGATPGEVGSYTCPVGYSLGSDGVCGKTASDTIGCPAGYVNNDSGQCVSPTGVPANQMGSGSGSGSGETGNSEQCGVAGGPACPSLDVGELTKGVVDGYSASKSSWFSWVWTPPIGTCSPFAGNVHGFELSWDLCPTIANIRDVLGWILAVFGAWTVYLQLFRKAE